MSDYSVVSRQAEVIPAADCETATQVVDNRKSKFDEHSTDAGFSNFGAHTNRRVVCACCCVGWSACSAVRRLALPTVPEREGVWCKRECDQKCSSLRVCVCAVNMRESEAVRVCSFVLILCVCARANELVTHKYD